MAVKVADLKQKEVRKVITVMFEDNKVEQVTVYNPIGEKRQEILAMMNEYSNKTTAKATQELTKEILKSLTDLKIYKKDDIEDIISNPTGELLMVLKEVNEIKTELEYEFWTQKIMELNQATINILTAKAMEKSRHLHELSQELEVANENTDNLEEILDELAKEEVLEDGETV